MGIAVGKPDSRFQTITAQFIQDMRGQKIIDDANT